MSENFTIKTFVRRNARTSIHQKECYEKLFPKYCIDLKEKILDFPNVFGNPNDTIIEIGFGSGDATAKIALANPEKNYLAIEVFQTGVAKLLSKIEVNSIDNVRIIENDAIKVLTEMIPQNSIAGFHIFFPDPWQKKRHHKRRLMQEDKISLLCEKLVTGGYIYFVTDWSEYADYALTELQKVSGLKNCYKGFAEKQSWRPQTNFEKKALIAGRQIFEILAKKI